jgi:hypothetical protein
MSAPQGPYEVGQKRARNLYRRVAEGVSSPQDWDVAKFDREDDARYVAMLLNEDQAGNGAVNLERHRIADELDVLSDHDGECTQACALIAKYATDLRQPRTPRPEETSDQ